MRYFIITLVSLFLLGCGTSSSIRTINVSKAPLRTTNDSSFTFTDDRPHDEKMSRADTSANGTTVFFGDNNVNPPGPELVKTSLQNALPFQLKGKRVSLKEFVLYVYDPAKSVDSGLLNSAAGSVKGGYAAAPFAGLLVGGINSMTSEKTIRVLISGAVDGAEFSTNVADHYRGLSNEEHIQATLSKALENVVIDVKRAIEMK